ncbi:hypothetical protein ACH40F_58595 [Streptomyces sp. NPDC020794]|uniref:hypothetical protein n=1 Tax=unclassified Streptomyces TaxID=2593676 RepID=UPI0036E1769F
MQALRIASDTTVTGLTLPDLDARRAIREHLGSTGAADEAVYHRRALLQIHGSGQSIGLQQNLAAWALASAWRGMALYPLHGPVVITGRTQDGGVAPLDDDLAQYARAVAQTVRETLIEWQARHPATNEAAIAELLAYAFRDVTTDR